MLETEIKNNTAALAALAAAVADLTAAVLAMKDDDPVVVVPVDPAPAPVAAQAAPVAAQAAPVAPVAPAAAAPAAPVAPVAPAPAPVAAPAMSGDDLRKLCVRAGAAGLTAEVVAFLSANGCQKLAQLPPEKYGDLVALLNSKGVE